MDAKTWSSHCSKTNTGQYLNLKILTTLLREFQVFYDYKFTTGGFIQSGGTPPPYGLGKFSQFHWSRKLIDKSRTN